MFLPLLQQSTNQKSKIKRQKSKIPNPEISSLPKRKVCAVVDSNLQHPFLPFDFCPLIFDLLFALRGKVKILLYPAISSSRSISASLL